MRNPDGWNSPRCTAKWCRRHLDPGAGIQMLIDGVEHRHCVQHHAESMRGSEVENE